MAVKYPKIMTHGINWDSSYILKCHTSFRSMLSLIYALKMDVLGVVSGHEKHN
jgi:hypothetical protein